MSHDALFQLGMGPVDLDATQTEESFARRAVTARRRVFRFAVAARRNGRRRYHRSLDAIREPLA